MGERRRRIRAVWLGRGEKRLLVDGTANASRELSKVGRNMQKGAKR